MGFMIERVQNVSSTALTTHAYVLLFKTFLSVLYLAVAVRQGIRRYQKIL
jgi:hypothetical protein